MDTVDTVDSGHCGHSACPRPGDGMESGGELSQARGPGLGSADWSLSYASLSDQTKAAHRCM